jgi:hypothetical protein
VVEGNTPAGDIPCLYSLAASGDDDAELQLIELYKPYIKGTAENLKAEHHRNFQFPTVD